ncbi:hypothetical protein LshimejAT787_0409110 [Lyophyllum shimeji]|uniref:Uncharacterized protein n=1 Tax=Lyophyllum shimeji TaxID=47721 RepID=A0A9P3PKD0_LYOSH|nr:hypothetical protein LshimejAT787_0409110 [Lyophyllum shimeji]
MPLPPTTIIAKAVPELGGPVFEPADIEWASHIPTGHELVQWLVDQCVASESGPESGFVGSEGFEVDLGAALRAIALEDEELQILKYAESTRVDDDGDMHGIHAPLTYAPPSHLRKHATFLDTETRLLDTETAALKSRLRQTKHASQRAAQTISSLEAAIEREDAVIAHVQERLAELSVLADSTISSGSNSALVLIDTLAPPQPQSQEIMNSARSMDPAPRFSLACPTQTLTRLASLRAALRERHASRTAQLTLQSPKQLLDDAADLSCSLEALVHNPVGNGAKRLREAAFALQLRRIYEALGNAGTIPAVNPDEDVDVNAEDVNVKASLDKAWALDQFRMIDAEFMLLDFTIQVHNDTLLPGLRALHAQLSARERAVRAAEAWVGAFGIEVEGIGEARRTADTAGNGNVDQAAVDTEPQQEFEQQLKDLLLQYHKEHAAPDAAPLVLLNNADVLDELRRIRKAADEGDGDGWKDVARLRESLGSLNATHHPLLDVLYSTRTVQTNASPPFGLPAGTEELEQRTQEAVLRLETGVGRGDELEKILDGKRTQRKLGDFIDRWLCDSWLLSWVQQIPDRSAAEFNEQHRAENLNTFHLQLATNSSHACVRATHIHPFFTVPSFPSSGVPPLLVKTLVGQYSSSKASE